MSKLNINQVTIKDLFESKRSDFLIPDYQRPYAWTEDECQTLWEDIFEFSFPENDFSKFNSDDEYYLGPIVTFLNSENKLEIIDGQQRLTTLMLLLRAFYTRFGSMQDDNSVRTRETIEKCLWKTDEFGRPDKSKLKIDSEVATDKDKEEFLEILKTGEVSKSQKSQYAQNFRFFQERIEEFLMSYPSFFPYLPTRILSNCILLPIEADDQNTALRIFSTLNDRGKPLSDADIFKAQFYNYYSKKGQKDEFMTKWKSTEELCEKIFGSNSSTAMDELFTRYMYFERAKQGIKSSTTEALRKFYEKNQYELLKNDYIFDNLIELANFWKDVYDQNEERFNSDILRKFYVLKHAPNGMWTYYISVYYMQNKDANGKLDNDKFNTFLEKSIAFIWGYALTNPGVNALRTPIYTEMINIINGQEVEYNDFKFDMNQLEVAFSNFNFYNQRPLTKSMLAWWAYLDSEQEIFNLDEALEIEHIYPRRRAEATPDPEDDKYVESLGNKALLEKKINIRASDYKFEDKKAYYLGTLKNRKGTKIKELIDLANTKNDFLVEDIIEREKQIRERFLQYVRDCNLAK